MTGRRVRGDDRLLLCEDQPALARGHLDRVAGLELAVEQLHGERIEQALLDRALERARAKQRIVAFSREEFLRGLFTCKVSCCAARRFSNRWSWMSTMLASCSSLRLWKLITSSTRLRNSGREWRVSSAPACHELG